MDIGMLVASCGEFMEDIFREMNVVWMFIIYSTKPFFNIIL